MPALWCLPAANETSSENPHSQLSRHQTAETEKLFCRRCLLSVSSRLCGNGGQPFLL